LLPTEYIREPIPGSNVSKVPSPRLIPPDIDFLPMNICVNQCLAYQVNKPVRNRDRKGEALPEMNTIIHRPITYYDNYHYGVLVYDPY
jgi:hypothetical protein